VPYVDCGPRRVLYEYVVYSRPPVPYVDYRCPYVSYVDYGRPRVPYVNYGCPYVPYVDYGPFNIERQVGKL